MNRCIVTYAEGPHEELLDIALPTYKVFADKHGYDLVVGHKLCNMPPAWNKVPLLIDALHHYSEVVWFDSDLMVVDPSEDFPPMYNVLSDPSKRIPTQDCVHSLVRHFAWDSEVPNSGVWRLKPAAMPLLGHMLNLEVFQDHGWWEQAALMTLMGYVVPPQGSDFRDTKCRCVHKTKWYNECRFMRLCWNSHPQYRSDHPRIVHCSYPSMPQRLEVMRTLARDPTYDYPRFEADKEDESVAEW